MGFTPAHEVFHTYSVRQYGDGNFDFSIQNGANPLTPLFTRSFTHVPSVGGNIGFSYINGGTGIFDNLYVRYSADLQSNVAPNSTINLGGAGQNQVITLPSALLLSNNGLANSTLNVTGATISGADAAYFATTGFSPAGLLAGSGSTSFGVNFLGGEFERDYNAILTLQTDIGSFTFDLQAAVVPEPSTAAILGFGVVGMGLVSRRRR
jgi:hypothetical protein